MMSKEAIYYLVNTLITSIEQFINLSEYRTWQKNWNIAVNINKKTRITSTNKQKNDNITIDDSIHKTFVKNMT